MADVSRKRDHSDPASGDRPLSECDDDLQTPAPKRRAAEGAQEVLFRVLVPSKQIGKVIGKEGSRIQRIREETQATIKISDPFSRYEDRVIIISSEDDGGEVSKAENALYSIARVLLTEDDKAVIVSNACGGLLSANMIRLLITGSQAGCLIGTSGQDIEQIRSFSNAMITILAPNQFTCASAHESDRIVHVSGEVTEVLMALEKIGCNLRENPPKQVMSVRSVHAYNTTHSNPYFPSAPSAEHVTYEMMIMENLVGGLIGKNGSNISKIRYDSGATIKVTGMKGENLQRLIIFGGTPQQVAVARMLVENYVFSQLLQQGRS